jgi:cell division protein FtsB
MRWLLVILLVLFGLLQYRLWVGDGSLAEVWRLNKAVTEQRQENASLRDRNEALEAEVRDLKTGSEAIEERARSELGMIRDGETFYQVVEPAADDVDATPQ